MGLPDEFAAANDFVPFAADGGTRNFTALISNVHDILPFNVLNPDSITISHGVVHDKKESAQRTHFLPSPTSRASARRISPFPGVNVTSFR